MENKKELLIDFARWYTKKTKGETTIHPSDVNYYLQEINCSPENEVSSVDENEDDVNLCRYFCCCERPIKAKKNCNRYYHMCYRE